MSLCETCHRADAGFCPSYPHPVDHCQQWVPNQKQIQDWWWHGLGDRRLFEDVADGD